MGYFQQPQVEIKHEARSWGQERDSNDIGLGRDLNNTHCRLAHIFKK